MAPNWARLGYIRYQAVAGGEIVFDLTGDNMFKFSLYGRGNVPDEQVNFGTCTLTVTGGTVNEPPVADADGPYVGDVGEPVSLDGSGSFDPDLRARSDRELRLGPRQRRSVRRCGWAQPSVPWAVLSGLAQGVPLPIRLQVTDTHGAAGTDDSTLTIYDNQPVAAFTANPESGGMRRRRCRSTPAVRRTGVRTGRSSATSGTSTSTASTTTARG